jgi:hypothetical protein
MRGRRCLRPSSRGSTSTLVIEADDIDAVVEVAAGIPAARHGGAIEILPVETYW